MQELLGSFEQLVMLAVLRQSKDAYGRAVIREIETALDSRKAVSAGAVYATLDRLEAKGLLASRLEAGTEVRGGRARRFYTLTGRGAAALNYTHASMQKMWKGRRWPIETTT